MMMRWDMGNVREGYLGDGEGYWEEWRVMMGYGKDFREMMIALKDCEERYCVFVQEIEMTVVRIVG